MALPAGVRAVVTDVEGTITPIAFVHDVLFPYARSRLDRVCAAAGARPEIAAALRRLRAEHAAESAGDPAVPGFGDGAPYARYLMDLDRKSTALKELQGLIWEQGYRRGELLGQLFADVPPVLRAWRRAGIRLRVFSSGSVLAQKLLLGHTEHGDLTPLFEGFHDTTTGPKREPSSYRAIAAAFGLPGGEILFLSDLTAELDAAARAALRTGLLERPGNAPASGDDHPRHRSFRELLPRAEGAGRR